MRIQHEWQLTSSDSQNTELLPSFNTDVYLFAHSRPHSTDGVALPAPSPRSSAGTACRGDPSSQTMTLVDRGGGVASWRAWIWGMVLGSTTASFQRTNTANPHSIGGLSRPGIGKPRVLQDGREALEEAAAVLLTAWIAQIAASRPFRDGSSGFLRRPKRLPLEITSARQRWPSSERNRENTKNQRAVKAPIG